MQTKGKLKLDKVKKKKHNSLLQKQPPLRDIVSENKKKAKSPGQNWQKMINLFKHSPDR